MKKYSFTSVSINCSSWLSTGVLAHVSTWFKNTEKIMIEIRIIDLAIWVALMIICVNLCTWNVSCLLSASWFYRRTSTLHGRQAEFPDCISGNLAWRPCTFFFKSLWTNAIFFTIFCLWDQLEFVQCLKNYFAIVP